MKNRTLIFPTILAAAALLTAGATLAGPRQQQRDWQDGPWHGAPPSAERRLARLHDQLGLSEAQSVELLQRLQTRAAAHEELRARLIEEMQPEICALRQATEADILEVLTPEQAVLFQQLREQRPDGAAEHHGHGHGPLDCEGYGG